MTKQKEKLRNIFLDSLESGSKFSGNLKEINYISLLCRAGSEGNLTTLLGNNVCSFLCSYEDSSAALIVFAIPISVEDEGAKHIAERVMEVVELCEQSFTTLDYSSSKEVEEDKFVYVIVIKKFDEYYLKGGI